MPTKKKRITRIKKPVVTINLPPKYDQELLKQIKEIKEYPIVEKPILDKDRSVQTVKDELTERQIMVKAAGLLYDFKNPVKTEEDIKKLLAEQYQYSDQELVKAFNVTDQKVVYEYSSVYKSQQNWKFLEAIRVNGPVSNGMEKTFDFVTGIDYTHLQTDVNDTFPDNDMKSAELEKINNNFVIFSLKNELEEIDRKVGLRNKILSLFINKRTFGRAAQKIIINETTLLPEAIEILFPMLLGRVFYTQRTKQIVGIEYDDTNPENKLIPASLLIYAVNRDYGQSPGSLFYGYSDVEFFQHLVDTDFIIDAFDLKEINRDTYISKKIIQILDKEDANVTKLRQAIEVSDKVVTKHPVVIHNLGSEHEGNFLMDERSKNEDKITNDLGIPPILVGRAASDTYATTQQVMQSFNETTVNKIRMEVRDVYETLYYYRNLKQLVKNKLALLKQLRSKYLNGDRTSETILQDLLVYNRDNLSDTDKEQIDLLKQELKMQKERENWEEYKEHFFKKRLDIIKKIINDNSSFSAEEADDVFNQIKDKIEKNQSFELEDLGADIKTPKKEQPKPKPVLPKVSQGFDYRMMANADMLGISGNGNGEMDTQEEKEGWQDTSVPSPSNIDFEIAELEKLVMLEPSEYPFKYKMTFKNASLITELEKTAATISKKKESIIQLNDARNELGYEDIVSRETLREKLQSEVNDIVKKYVKPETEQDQQLVDTNMPNQMLPTEMMNNEGINTEQQDQPQGKTIGINLQSRVKNQQDKYPRVKVDQTSLK